MVSNATKWRLRAEEYRAVAEAMQHLESRTTFTQMAETCERIAAQTDLLDTPLQPADCLQMAESCDAFAAQFETPGAKRATAAVAERWRNLAADGER